MPKNIYFDFWKSQLTVIIDQFSQGRVSIQLPVPGLAELGDRNHYRSNFRIEHGRQVTPERAQAHGRDLFEVLNEDEYFKTFLSDKIIQVGISKDLHLSMEILPPGRPDFFTEEDFELLGKYAGEDMDSNNTDHVDTYNALKNTYLKTEYWAHAVKKPLFADGSVELRKRPTNRANRFEEYQWSKIYPDKRSSSVKILAFTVGIDTDSQFIVKIDTVGQGANELQQVYEQIRGDFYNSSIVKIFSSEEILGKGWDHLINVSVKSIKDLQPAFNNILDKLINKPDAMTNTYKAPLNTILYGPPGTGKTFCTFRRAVEIASPNPDKATKEKMIEEYRRLMVEGQIQFVTFHQNYSYEDFVLGIRPDLMGDEMKFTRHEGIFFKLCKEAQKNYTDSLTGVTYEEPSYEDILDKFLEPVTARDEPITINTKEGYPFQILQRNQRNLNFEKSSGSRDHTLSLATLKQIYTGERTYVQGLGVYFYPLVDKLKEQAQKMRKEVGKIPLKNYVLIIDEINRANISRVFGELISLLEEDKRIGRPYELQVTLPNGEKFGVPPNLYILGTMNTADKSIALLDIALRRRFVFEAMYPREADIDELVPAPYNLLLKELNKKVREQKGADFMIGHAYFIPDENRGTLDLVSMMNQKVIPLLNEYFYSQRDNPVYRLLKPLEPYMNGCTVTEDGYIGTSINPPL